MPEARPPRREPLRLEDCREDIVDDIRRSVAATGGANNLYLTFARHPGLFKRYVPFGAKLFSRSSLSERDRELAILRTAVRCDSEYEWHQHVRIAESVGMPLEEILAVRNGAHGDEWSREDLAVLHAVDELVAQHEVSDATWVELGRTYSDEQLIEFVFLVGTYVMLAGFLKTFRVGVEDEPRPDTEMTRGRT